MDCIEPIGAKQQQIIRQACEKLVSEATQRYGKKIKSPQVDFDLKGKSAGMYQVKRERLRTRRRIRINPWIAASNFEETIADTVPHEVAHYVVDCLYGIRRVKAHGLEWQEVMKAFGATPRARGSYTLEGIPHRQYRRFEYRCDCRTHWLTAIRHNRVGNRQANYHCRYCGMAIQAVT